MNQNWIETKIKVNTQEFKKGMNEAKQEAKNLQQSLRDTGKAGADGAGKFSKGFIAKIKEGRGDLIFLGTFLGNVLGEAAGKAFGNTFNAMTSGAITGGFVGSAFGGVGGAVGALVGGIAGFFGGRAASKNSDAKDLREYASLLNISSDAVSKLITRIEKLGYTKEKLKDLAAGGDTYKQMKNAIDTTYIADNLGLADLLKQRKDEARANYTKLMAQAAKNRSMMPAVEGVNITLKESDIQNSLARLDAVNKAKASEAIENLGGIETFVVRINEALDTSLASANVFKDTIFNVTPYDAGINTKDSIKNAEDTIDRMVSSMNQMQFDALGEEEKLVELANRRVGIEREIQELRSLPDLNRQIHLGAQVATLENESMKIKSAMDQLSESIKGKRENLQTQRQALTDKLGSIETQKADRNRLTLGELANSNVYTRQGAYNRAAAREALGAEYWAKQAMVEGRGDLSNQYQAYADRIRQSIDGLTSAERNPMQAVLSEEVKANVTLRSIDDKLSNVDSLSMK